VVDHRGLGACAGAVVHVATIYGRTSSFLPSPEEEH
jgi:hypothetical protein